jgi:hypothetical protein
MRLLFYLVLYIIYALPLFVIARKSQHPMAWLAFVPLADLWLMCDMADKEIWWILVALLVPFVGWVLFNIVVWTAIAENTNKPSWLGILMVIPVVNLFVGYYLAFYDSERFVA